MNQKTMPLEQVKKVELFGEEAGIAGGVRLFFLPAVDGHYGLSFQVQCGAWDTLSTQEEACHLVEHLLVATPVYGGNMPSLIDAYANFLSDSSAATSMFRTTFTAIPYPEKGKQNPAHLLKFLDYLYQALYEAELTEEVFLREKEYILQELDENKLFISNNCASFKRYVGGSDFTRFYKSDAKKVQALSLGMCQNFYKEVFCKAPLDVVLMGDFPIDDVVAFFAEKKAPSWKRPPQKRIKFKPFIRLTNNAIEVPLQTQEDEALKHMWSIAFFKQLETLLDFPEDGHVRVTNLEVCTLYICENTLTKRTPSAIKQALLNVTALSKTDYKSIKKAFIKTYTEKEKCVDASDLDLTPRYCDLIAEAHELDFSTFKTFAIQQKSLPIK